MSRDCVGTVPAGKIEKMYGLTKARVLKIMGMTNTRKRRENLPISSGGTGHSMVAGLDSFPSVPMNRPSPGIIQIMRDKPEDILTVLSKQNL